MCKTKLIMIPLSLVLIACGTLGNPEFSAADPNRLTRNIPDTAFQPNSEKLQARREREKITSEEMAKIIETEIATQMEVNDVEKASGNDFRRKMAMTWLERAKSLAEIKQYGEALEAAENVFLYDPDNHQASFLIDEIKRKAYREGKAEFLIVEKEIKKEVGERLLRYRNEAKTWYEAGYWSAAKLAVEKILLLNPEDQEALRLHQQIRAKLQGEVI